MLSISYNLAKERIRATLEKKGCPIIEVDREKTAVREELLHLIRDTCNGTTIKKAFCNFALQRSDDSYSRYQQEFFAVCASGSKQNGTFIELGAADGVTHGNTFMLERFHGWSGVLIESPPWAYAQAKRRRPNTHVIQGAADPIYASEPRTLNFVSAGSLARSIATKITTSTRILERIAVTLK